MMLPYLVKGRKNTESNDPRVAKTENKKIMLLSKCAVYNNKK